MYNESSVVKKYTITETAKLSGLPESTLRYYETIGIIQPIERDNQTKRRVYTEDDINLILGISCLSATGLSIEDMRQYLANNGKGAFAANAQIALLESQDKRLVEEEYFLKLRQKYLRMKVRYWKAVEVKDRALAEEILIEGRELARELKTINTKHNKGEK